MNESIAQELIQLAQHDLRVRERLLKENKLSDGYKPEMELVHQENAARLKEIIYLIGWPTRSKVGEEASEAAWLIVQHAIGEPAFMKRCYALLVESMEDVNPKMQLICTIEYAISRANPKSMERNMTMAACTL